MTDREKLYEAVIGHKNTDYYMAYFLRADERGYPPISWNWPGFFVGLIWLIYRRHYRWALFYFAVIPLITVGTGLLSGILGADMSVTLQLVGITLFQAIYFPLNANGIYYKWVQGEIEKAESLLGYYPAFGLKEGLENWLL